MPETEFLVLTVRARELADQIARREGVAAAEIVARALEAYADVPLNASLPRRFTGALMRSGAKTSTSTL